MASSFLPLACSFYFFSDAVQEAAAMRRAANRAVGHWLNRKLAATFSRWAERTAQRRRMQRIAKKVLGRALNAALSRAP